MERSCAGTTGYACLWNRGLYSASIAARRLHSSQEYSRFSLMHLSTQNISIQNTSFTPMLCLPHHAHTQSTSPPSQSSVLANQSSKSIIAVLSVLIKSGMPQSLEVTRTSSSRATVSFTVVYPLFPWLCMRMATSTHRLNTPCRRRLRCTWDESLDRRHVQMHECPRVVDQSPYGCWSHCSDVDCPYAGDRALEVALSLEEEVV